MILLQNLHIFFWKCDRYQFTIPLLGNEVVDLIVYYGQKRLSLFINYESIIIKDIEGK